LRDIVAKGNSVVLQINPTTLEFHPITSEQIKKMLKPHQIQHLKDKKAVNLKNFKEFFSNSPVHKPQVQRIRLK
jgi:hypothetical protein